MCRREDVGANADRTIEREANIFAAEVFMPEEAVRAEWPADVPELAAHFGVSSQAMHWALQLRPPANQAGAWLRRWSTKVRA